jgi:hypothetical protein
MPFKKVPGGGFVSPSGKHWTSAQVRLYYATDGFARPPKPKVKQRRPLFDKKA